MHDALGAAVVRGKMPPIKDLGRRDCRARVGPYVRALEGKDRRP